MRDRWKRLSTLQKRTFVAVGILVLIGLIISGNDHDAGTPDEPARKDSVLETTATPTPAASESYTMTVGFKLPRDSYGVFKTRSSRAIVTGRVRPAQTLKLYWELRKVPGAKLIDKGVVTTSADGSFQFVVLGLRRGEHRLLVDTSRIDSKTSSAASIAVSRTVPKPKPTATPAPPPTPTPTPQPTATPKPASNCDTSYTGACLKPDSPDYDCAGGSGDGPDYTGEVRVVGPDHYDLDRDGDGIACDT